MAGAFVEEQAVTLAQRYAVTVIAPHLRQWKERPVAARRPELETRRGVEIVRIDAVPALPRIPRLVYAAHADAVRHAYRAVVARNGRPEVIHAHVVRHAGLSALALGRSEDLPVILTEHSGPFSAHLRHPLDRRRVIQGLPRFDAVIAVSPHLRDQMAAVADVRIDVIGNVIDTDFFRPSDTGRFDPPDDTFRILTVALLTADKRVDLVIDAVALCLSRTTRPVELRVVGDGPERSVLERLVVKRSLERAVQFGGLADRTVVRDEMQRADAFVLASDAETFGVVLAEAMSCGVPVVATRAGGPEYVIEPGTGLLVPTGDVEALAAALGQLMSDSSIANGAAARENIVRRFSRRAFLHEVGRVYDRVVVDETRSRMDG